MHKEWEEELDDSMLGVPDVGSAEKVSHEDFSAFVKRSFESVLALHEELISAKDDQIEILSEENAFLKETLLSVQQLYAEDRELLQLLKKEIFDLQEELEFTRRKYKMMWNQAIENYSKRSSQ